MENTKEAGKVPTVAATAPTDEAVVVGVNDVADVEEEDYILIDDVTGDRVEPNAETSLLMAIAIENEMMAAAAAEEKEDNNTNDMGSPQITVVDEHDALYIEGMKNMGAFFAATQSFDFCVSSSDDEGEGDGAEPKDVVEGAKESVGTKIDGTDKVIVEKDGADDNDDEGEGDGAQPKDAAEGAKEAPAKGVVNGNKDEKDGADGDDDEVEEEDEGGMEQYGSRYESDIGYDGEWTLEKLLQRRRVNKKTLQQQQRQRQMDGDDYCDDLTQVGGSGRAQQSGMEYLCRWRWYSEPTWESREWLEDLGYKKEADSFDADIAARGQHVRSEARGKGDTSRKRLVKPPPPTSLFDKYFPDLLKNICEQLHSLGFRLERYASCLSPHLEKRFMRLWKENHRDRCPIAVFHGTRTHCVHGIVTHGLRVPGIANGIAVSNGAAFGRGIYTSRFLNMPLAYAGKGGYIFVCAGLYGPGIESYRAEKGSDNILIFPEERLVLPFMLIKVARGTTDEKKPWETIQPKSLVPGTMKFTAFRGTAGEQFLHQDDDPSTNEETATSSSSPTSAAAAADILRSEPGGHVITKMAAGRSGKGMSKKMVKKAPRYVKDFYQRGLLRNKK